MTKMQNPPDMDELQARFSDLEATYKDLLAASNATIANLNVMLRASQRELQKASAELENLQKQAVDSNPDMSVVKKAANGAYDAECHAP